LLRDFGIGDGLLYRRSDSFVDGLHSPSVRTGEGYRRRV
jgi:hypothetical protein